MKNLYALPTLLTLLIVMGSTALSAQYYWVGNSGDWTDFANHWATTSGGSMFHTSAPTEDDDVYFDANSFTEGGAVVNVDEDYTDCRNLICTGVTNEPMLDAASSSYFRIHDGFILSGDMTYNMKIIEMRNSDGISALTSNGAFLGSSSNLYFNSTGSWELQDGVHGNRIQVSQGNFISNDQTITGDHSFELAGTFSKSATLGSSELHLGQFRLGGTNNALNAGTSHIYCYTLDFTTDEAGPFAVYDVTLNNDNSNIYGSGSINTLDITATASPYGSLNLDGGETITINEIVGTASRVIPFKITSTIPGTAATLNKTSGSVDLEYLFLKDIHATGGASFNAVNCEDLGNNTGWNITAIVPWDFYWVGGTGNWEVANNWSDVSGGSAAYDTYPSIFDHVILDNNGFDADNQTVTVNEAIWMASLDATGVTMNSPNLNAGYGFPMHITGDIDFGSNMDKTIHSVRCVGGGVQNINFGSVSGVSYPSFTGGGVYNLLSDFDCASLTMSEGELNTNGHDIWCNYNFAVYSGTDAVNFGDSEIDCLRWQMNTTTAALDYGTSHIIARGEFKGNNGSYYEATFSEEVIVYTSNDFEILNFAPNGLITMPAGETQTANQIYANGTPDAPISIISSEDGTQSTLSQASGMVNATYLILKDSEASGGATFNATQTLDNGNNTGWNITEITPQDYYWVGGTGNWSDAATHWANSSGGTPSYAYAPGVLDNVYFDANSFGADGETVTLDSESANCHDLDWSAIDQQVLFDGIGTAINVYGSFILGETMDMSVNNINFFSPEAEVFDPGYTDGPGTNHYLTFSGGGSWTFLGEVTCRELTLTAGTINTDGFDLWVDFKTRFESNSAKVLNVQDITYYTRSLTWEGSTGDNLVLNGQNGVIECSSTFAPGNFGVENIEVNLNDLRFWSPGFADSAEIQSDITVNTLTIDAGKFFEIWNGTVVTCNQLICEGTAAEPIVFQGGIEGTQAVISQASGVVNGEYLELKDIAAVGGATFYANNSQDFGNVSGWIFTGQAQSITFDPVADVMEDVGTFDLTVSASSGLDVLLEVLSGPATLDGTSLTITGPGPVVLKASQAGDDIFNPAVDVEVEFCSIPLQPTVTEVILDEVVELTSSATSFNQWYNDFGLLDGETGQLYTATESGTYYVQVEVDGCISEPSDSFEVIIIGIEESADATWSVYPNPFSDELNISTSASVGTTTFNVYSTDGRMVCTEVVPAMNGQQTMNFSGLASGQYTLSILSDNQLETVTLLKR